MRNRTYSPRYESQPTNWINIVLLLVFLTLAAAILAAVAPAIIRNWSQGTTPQPTAFVRVQPTVDPNVNVGDSAAPLPTAAPAAGSPPDVMPTPAPLAAPVGASGLTESMERKFEEAANPGLADQILNVVESWDEATPIPGGSPPVDKGGKKELGRPVSGGTSGGKTWEPKP